MDAGEGSWYADGVTDAIAFDCILVDIDAESGTVRAKGLATGNRWLACEQIVLTQKIGGKVGTKIIHRLGDPEMDVGQRVQTTL